MLPTSATPVNQQALIPHPRCEKFKKNLILAAQYIKSTVVDVISVIVLAVLFPFDQVKRDPKAFVANSNSIPVILVHGYLDNSSSWAIHRHRLKKEGIHNVFTVNMGVIPNHSIESCTEKLHNRILQVQKATGQNKVILIGHSMGGMVSSHYALTIAEQDGIKVTDVLTLGSPLQGTKVSRIGLGKSARQMDPKHEFSKDLSEKIKNETTVRFHHVASETDIIMRPWNTSLNGKTEPSENDLKVEMGHITYLFSKKISVKMKEVITETCGIPV